MNDDFCFAYSEDATGEIVRLAEEKEIKQAGEYRTLRLVLESWDKLER